MTVVFDSMLKSPGISSIRGKFNTHSQYTFCIEKHFKDLQISCELNQENVQPLSRKHIDRFVKLSKATHASLVSEASLLKDNAEYARVAATWIPVKCYYVIYYLEATAMHLIDTQDIYFGNGGHLATRKSIKAQIISKKLKFSNEKVSNIHTIGELHAHSIAMGANQRASFYTTDKCILSIQKTLMKYPEDNFKNSINATKGYRTKNSQLARDKFYSSQISGMNLTEFFYWMRIKINYKDADHLNPISNEEIPDMEITAYINSYLRGYNSYRIALEELISNLLAQRTMDKI